MTTVSLDDTLDDWQAESRASTLGLSCLPEPVEDMREIVRGNADTGVGYPEEDFLLSRSCSDRDSSADPSELGRVAYEILEYL